MLALVVNANDSENLVVRADGQDLTLDAGNVDDVDDASGTSGAGRAVSAVHKLLHSTGIFISSEKAGL